MRFIVLGAGGVGGVIGGRLHQHGHEVVLIARGAHLEAIRSNGLRLEDPDATAVLDVPAVGSPSEVAFGVGDVVILATKSQDANAALDSLRSAAPSSTPVLCATNGVEAERLALRRFQHVHGINVLMPTAYLQPGVVQVISAPVSGGLDVGRYPRGVDATTAEVAAALSGSTFSSDPVDRIMRLKYRKLVLNTANAVEAACGNTSPAARRLIHLAASEAEAVYAAAGIDVASAEEEQPKRALMVYRPIAGQHRGGGSTWQSIARGTSVETDYLNGEIVLLGRLHEVPTPVNAMLQELLADLSVEGAAPAAIDAEALLAQVQPAAGPVGGRVDDV